MGTQWLGYYFVDTQLPFGLRSSPGIFNRFADAVCWILQERFTLPNTMHYSDDFFLVAGTYETALLDLNKAESAFKYLGIPSAEEKKSGPSTKITYLGIEINSTNLTMCLPPDKYSALFHDSTLD